MSWYNPFSWGAGPTYNPDPSRAQLGNGDKLRTAGWSGFQTAQAGRQAPQAGPTTVGNVAQMNNQSSDQIRGRQVALFNQLGGIASGTQRGAGEMAVQQGINRAAAQQQALARMGRGTNAASAGRMAARTIADLGVSGAGQMGQARLQDQQFAMQQLGQGLAGARQQDIGIASANMDAQNQRIFQQAGLDQATSLANMQARLQQQGMDDQQAMAYLSMMFGMDQAELNARMQQDAIRAGSYQQGPFADLLVAGGQIGTAAALASDKRLKKKVEPGKQSVKELLGSIEPYHYRYKDEKHGKGDQFGLMAQDLEKSRAGRQMVVDTPSGKVVDTRKVAVASLLAAADIDRRLAELEKKAG